MDCSKCEKRGTVFCDLCTIKDIPLVGCKCGHCGAVLEAPTRKELNLKKIRHEARACGMGPEYASKISWLGVASVVYDPETHITSWKSQGEIA
jgi:hypothetical protein